MASTPLFDHKQLLLLTGAEMLLYRIGNREKEYPTEIVVAPELVVRESTGPASAKRGS